MRQGQSGYKGAQRHGLVDEPSLPAALEHSISLDKSHAQGGEGGGLLFCNVVALVLHTLQLLSPAPPHARISRITAPRGRRGAVRACARSSAPENIRGLPCAAETGRAGRTFWNACVTTCTFLVYSSLRRSISDATACPPRRRHCAAVEGARAPGAGRTSGFSCIALRFATSICAQTRWAVSELQWSGRQVPL
jgi:hypothetical protein